MKGVLIMTILETCYSGDTPWPDLDDLVDADDDTMFDADFDEILEDDDE